MHFEVEILNIDIPSGVRIFNRIETSQIKEIQKKISEIFEKWGYEEIYLPSFEFFSVHSKGFGKEIENKAFKIIDRHSGEILSLRADFTSQIARYFASLKKKYIPKRYYYSGNIYRYVVPKAENLWEINQMGIELIGVKELEGDAEVIAVAVQCLENLGIKNYQIDLNSVQIFDIIRRKLNLNDNEYIKLMEFIKKREVFNLENFISKFEIPKSLKDFIVNIPEMQGSIKLIESIRKDISDQKDILTIFDEIEKIYSILTDYGISEKIQFDIGEPKEFSYYTGMVFEIFIKGFMKPVGQGGRYDSLIKRYNGDYPATGFAFNILNLWDYLKENDLIQGKKTKDFFIIDTTKEKKNVYKISNFLRENGFSVSRDIVDRNLKDSMKYGFDEGFRYIIVIGLDSSEKDVYIYSSMEQFEKVRIEKSEDFQKIIDVVKTLDLINKI